MRRLVWLALVPYVLWGKPSAVGDVLTGKGNVRAKWSTSYIHFENSQSVTVPIQYQTVHGDVVTIPTYVGDAISNSDLISSTLALHYGVTKDLELYAALNGYGSLIRTKAGSDYRSKHEYGLSAASIGATYRIKDEDDTPSLIVGASTNILDRIKIGDTAQNNYLKTFRVFASSYYTVDPLVFSLSASYTHSRTKKAGTHTLKSGDVLSITPAIYFAVNPSASLKWGARYSYQAASKADGKQVGLQGSSVAYFMGAGYEFDSGVLVDMQAEYKPGNAPSTSISTSISYKFK